MDRRRVAANEETKKVNSRNYAPQERDMIAHVFVFLTFIFGLRCEMRVKRRSISECFSRLQSVIHFFNDLYDNAVTYPWWRRFLDVDTRLVKKGWGWILVLWGSPPFSLAWVFPELCGSTLSVAFPGWAHAVFLLHLLPSHAVSNLYRVFFFRGKTLRVDLRIVLVFPIV